MNGRAGALQRLVVLALLATLGGCELMKHVRIQTDDRNPNAFAQARQEDSPGAPASMAPQFRLVRPHARD